jgi:hypothetical protein
VKRFRRSDRHETQAVTKLFSLNDEDVLKSTPVNGKDVSELRAVEVLMTKHRTITGFVAVALLAVAATQLNPTVDANKFPAADSNDRWSAMLAVPPNQTAERKLT